ncbi:MAG: ABC transporter permease, partial [Microbacterium sp.]
IAIVLTRDIAQIEHDQRTLRALGLTRRQRMELYAPRALLIAGGGALIAGGGAVLLSPRFPIGLARQAEPNPGLHADWTVLAIAIPLVVAVVLSIAFVAALRATRRDVFDRPSNAYRRTSAIVEGFAALGLRPTATNGLRMAIQSGRGEVAVPLRSAFVGAVFGVAGVTAALVFAASLTHLTDTPRLYGWSFDLRSSVVTTQPCVTTPDYGMGKQAGIGDIAAICSSTVELDGRPVNAWGFRSLRGTIEPVIVEGRAPRGDHEVALGSVTLDASHKQVDDTVRVVGERGRGQYRIVGRAVFPIFGSPQPLADGAAFTGAGLAPLRETGENETDNLVARLKPSADLDAVRARLESVTHSFQGQEVPRFAFISGPSTPVEVERLQQIDRIPMAIAALLGVLALLAVAHAIVTAVRRRRSELALLKVLGFERGEVRATVAWQATILGVVGLVLGIPIGIIIGRLVWNVVASGLGVATVVTTPALWLLVSVPIVLLLVNLIAFFPARSASRTRPAVALRST